MRGLPRRLVSALESCDGADLGSAASRRQLLASGRRLWDRGGGLVHRRWMDLRRREVWSFDGWIIGGMGVGFCVCPGGLVLRRWSVLTTFLVN